MRKKLQVYICSTYYDLIEERHAAVEAVLNNGHIPVGIEQFYNERQLKTIKRSIDESDVFVLILGGFYGLLLRDESKSYTQWEYDYAGEIGKPRFAIVVTDEALRLKPYDFTAIENYQRFQEFKQSVFEETPTYYAETELHVKYVIQEKMKEFAGRDDLSGWYSGKDIPDVKQLMEENARLLKENAKLRAELGKND